MASNMTATRCSILQHAAKHCNALQHDCNTLRHTAAHCKARQQLSCGRGTTNVLQCVAVYSSVAAHTTALELWLRYDNCVLGWLRLVGSLKSYVSFAEYSLLYRALLYKRPVIIRLVCKREPIILMSLLIVATPY